MDATIRRASERYCFADRMTSENSLSNCYFGVDSKEASKERYRTRSNTRPQKCLEKTTMVSNHHLLAVKPRWFTKLQGAIHLLRSHQGGGGFKNCPNLRTTDRLREMQTKGKGV